MSTSNPLYGARRTGRTNALGAKRVKERERAHRRAVSSRLHERQEAFVQLYAWTRWRYYRGAGNRHFCWTTERQEDGKFVSFIMAPTGRWAKSGGGQMEPIRSSVRFHTRRTDAKDRAFGEAAKARPA